MISSSSLSSSTSVTAVVAATVGLLLVMVKMTTVVQTAVGGSDGYNQRTGHLVMAFRPTTIFSPRRRYVVPWQQSSSSSSSLYYENDKEISSSSSSLSSLQTSRPSSTSSSSSKCRPVSWVQSVSLIENDCQSALNELLMQWNVDDRRQQQQHDNGYDCECNAVAFLFVSPPWADDLEEIANNAQTMVGTATQLISIVGSGVIGNDCEVEDSSKRVMSFFGFGLPPNSSVTVDEYTNKDSTTAITGKANTEAKSNLPFFATESPKENNKVKIDSRPTMDGMIHRRSRQSHIIFADPYFRDIQDVLDKCDDVQSAVAGAVTVASHKNQSTIALGRKVLKVGSCVSVCLKGNLGLQVVVSTGCRPIGPTYRVTSVNGPAVEELDSVRAVDQLEAAIESSCNQEDQALIRSKGIRGVLGGILQSDGSDLIDDDDDEDDDEGHDNNCLEKKDELQDDVGSSLSENELDSKLGGSDQASKARKMEQIQDQQGQPMMEASRQQDRNDNDFILRQVTGFQPRSGSILVCGRPQVQRGDFFRFHIRSALSARKDWEKVVSRAKAERLFLGPTKAGTILGALQFSCAARGVGLFSEQNVDLQYAHALLGTGTDYDSSSESSPTSTRMVAGMFTSAEIGPSSSSLSQSANDAADSQLPHKTFLHGFATVVALICDYSVENGANDDQMGDVRLNVMDGILQDVDYPTDAWA